MEEKTKAKSTTPKEVPEVEIRLEDKVSIISYAPWSTGFARILSVGDVSIAPRGILKLSREEIMAQAQSGNRLIAGIDGMGSHAVIYIDDEWTRKELGFDTETSRQKILSKDKVKEMFEIKSDSKFQSEILDNVKTRAEKFFLMDAIKSLKIDAYSRIAFCENHCGVRV